MDINTLNTLVTGAIWRAEQLDALGMTSDAAWREVSGLEERIARLVPAGDTEGRIARRGAIRAAIKAGDQSRAHEIHERYLAEDGIPRALRMELQELFRKRESELSERSPFFKQSTEKKKAMNRADIVERISDATGLARGEVGAVMEGFLKIIEEELTRGGTVELRRFGTFRCVKRAARRAVNPRTEEPVKVDARVVPVFKSSPELRDAVKGVPTRSKT